LDHHNKKKKATQALKDAPNSASLMKVGYAFPVPCTDAEILEQMRPYKDAICACERKACKAAWSMNAPGVFQNQFVAPGAFQKGVGEVAASHMLKRVMPVNFRLSTDEFKTLSKRFPDWYFQQVASGGHDHPISHVTAQVASFEAVAKLSRKRVLDVHGNPSANEATMLQRDDSPRFTTVVSLETPKDYLRQATKWGPEMRGAQRRYHVASGLRDIANHPDRIAHDKDAFLSVHTGYYYPMKEIANMMACSPGAPATFIMHRFEGQSGVINGGELSWVKDENGYVTQTNVKTGERYWHPDNSHWFNTNSWTNKSQLEAATDNSGALNSLTWTVNMVCEGTFVITAVAITSKAAHLDPLRLSIMPGDDAVLRYGGVDIAVGDERHFVPIPGTHAKLFDELRSKMNFKLRDDKKFQAHVNTCEAKAKLYQKEEGLITSSKVLSNIQLASFWVDFETDCKANAQLGESAAWMVRDQKLALTGTSMARGNVFTTHVMRSVVAALSAKDKGSCFASIVDNAVTYIEARPIAQKA